MIRLVLPFPPTVNTYWRHLSKGPLAGRVLVSEKGRKYRATIEAQLFGCKPLTSRLVVDIEALMPDLRQRDLDNIPKALLDALSHARFWLDDSQIDDLRVWRSPAMARPDGALVVTVTPAGQAGLALEQPAFTVEEFA